MTVPVTVINVVDVPPQSQTVLFGHIYETTPKPAAKAVAEEVEDEAETKVVRSRGRRPEPKATEGAETK